MHCELVVPGLLSLPVAARAPSLELLLARGRATRSESASLEAWLQAAFGLPGLAAGALTMMAGGADPGGAAWVRADPVHLRLLRDRMVLVPGEALSITGPEARSIAEALNAHFGTRLQIDAHEPLQWVARLETSLPLGNEPALALAGASAAPGTADALLTEIQMALHAHPVNEAREARGDAPVNSLWLWGAGPAPQGLASRWQSITADDALARGLARAAATRARMGSPGAAWLERSPEDGRHLVVLDSLRARAALSDVEGFSAALLALESEWFAPVLGALRDGRLGMLTVHVPDAREALAVETVRGDLRRVWRRPRSLDAWMG